MGLRKGDKHVCLSIHRSARRKVSGFKPRIVVDVSRSNEKRGGVVSRGDVSGRKIVKMKHGRGTSHDTDASSSLPSV